MLSRFRAFLVPRRDRKAASRERPTTDPDSDTLRSLGRRADERLADILRGHRSHLPGDQLTIHVGVPDYKVHPEAFLAELHLVVKPSGAHPGIYTAVAGIGATLESAVDSGLRSWEEGILLPILFAVGQPPGPRNATLSVPDPQTGRTWAWDVFLGPLQIAGDRAAAEEARRTIDAESLWDLLRAPLRTDLRGESIEGDATLAWVKVFLARQRAGEITSECQLNNASWSAGLAALSRFPWPSAPGHVSARQFIVLRESSHAR